MLLLLFVIHNYRINTFRRNDLLKVSLEHYISCSGVHEIQVIWSDQLNKPPTNLIDTKFQNINKIKYELHSKDSLNNRFMPREEVKTNVRLKSM
jgi:hypothetical protein